MKYLLVLLVVAVAIHIWRRNRRARMAARAQGDGRTIAPPQDMVACATCGLHLPRADALALPAARGQYFCCAEHRDAFAPR